MCISVSRYIYIYIHVMSMVINQKSELAGFFTHNHNDGSDRWAVVLNSWLKPPARSLVYSKPYRKPRKR